MRELIRDAWLIARKDLRIEFRTRSAFFSAVVFSLLAIVIFYFAWSLAVQEQFYLIWPIILRLVRRRYALVFPLLFLVAGDVAGLLAKASSPGETLAYRIVASLDSPIFYGVVAAFLLQKERTFRVLHRVAGHSWSVPLAIVLALLPHWMPHVPQDLFNLGITYLVISCVLAPPMAAGVVDNALCRHVGNVSYGIYLFHMLVLNVVRRLVPGEDHFLIFLTAFPVVVLLATASYRWFEKPFMGLRERLLAERPAKHPALVPSGPAR